MLLSHQVASMASPPPPDGTVSFLSGPRILQFYRAESGRPPWRTGCSCCAYGHDKKAAACYLLRGWSSKWSFLQDGFLVQLKSCRPANASECCSIWNAFLWQPKILCGSAGSTGLFISPRNILKIHNKYTTRLIMVVLTLIEKRCFFLNIFHRCSVCPPLAIRQTSMR